MPLKLNLAERVRLTRAFWAGGEIRSLMSLVREDAVLAIYNDARVELADLIHGPEAIEDAFLKFRASHPDLRLRSAFSTPTSYAYVLSNGEDFALQVEPDGEGKIRRAALCRSLIKR